MKVVIRVTSRGNALMHEMLTHYCDSGNRPRMAGKTAPDGKTVAFEVLDISGSTQRGHMADTVFTIVDANHHLEEWTSIFPGGKRMTGRFDLQRTKEASGPFGQ